MRKRKLSRAAKRESERRAAEEFFSRRSRPETQFRPLTEKAPTPAQPAQETADLPRPGSTLGIEDSKEILRRLASGEIKQMRRR
jgi:hypothetical protein